jgi:hypothetical protein
MTFGFHHPMPDLPPSETRVGHPTILGPPEGQGLPDDLLQQASRRLAVLCLISACIWAANLLLLNFVYAVPGTVPAERVASYWRWRPVYDLVATANILASLGLLWYTRRSRRSARSLLDLALGYEVFTALSVALLDYAEPGRGSSAACVRLPDGGNRAPRSPEPQTLPCRTAESEGSSAEARQAPWRPASP